MLREIDRFLNTVGVSIYHATNGVPDQFPLAIDTEVTLPTITFPSQDAQVMGTMSVPNQTACDSLECSFNLPNNPKVIAALQGGVQTFIIRSAVNVSAAQTGNVSLKGFTATVSGFVSSRAGASLSVGGDANIEVTVQCTYYRLADEENNELYCIDRPNGILKVGGNDLRAQIRNLL